MLWKNEDDNIVTINYEDKPKINLKLILPILIIVTVIIVFILLFIKLSHNTKTDYYIELKGSDEITIYLGEEYLEPGYIAYDNQDNDVTDQVRIVNTINKEKIGSYEVAYILGTQIQKRTVNIINKKNDYTTIHLKGNLIEYIELGKEYQEPGYVAIDTDKGDVTQLVTVTGKVNTKKLGVYKLIYTIVDTDSIVTTTSRTIIVTKSSINLTPSTNNHTNTSVIINIGVIDSLFSYMILPNGEKITSKTYQYEVTQNGTYKFIEYNKNNEIKEEIINISNIDKTPPNGTCQAEVRNNTKITIHASDQSGIKYYQINNQNYYQDTFTLDTRLNNVEVKIFDNANNHKDITCTLNILPQSSSSKPSSSKPSTSQPSSSKPSASQPSSSKPSASQSSSSKPSASQSSSSKPSASQPSASQPSASQPSASQPSASQPSASQPSSDYDTISETFSGNKKIADFLERFEGADSGYGCNNGNGYKVKKYSSTLLTTAYGLTNLAIKSDSNPYGIYPCDTMSQTNKKYFTPAYYVANACLPKGAVQEALVCEINYAKNYINNRIKKCNSNFKITKQQMAALVDYFNSGIGFAKKAMDAYCDTYNNYHSQSKAEDAMFKSIFKKENGNSNGNCKFIKRRECEAILYFEGNYTCYGQSAYDGTFTYRYKKYHDSSYTCNK